MSVYSCDMVYVEKNDNLFHFHNISFFRISSVESRSHQAVALCVGG